MHLRTRVLLLTTAFALALFGITFVLSWRATTFAVRWRQLSSQMQTLTAEENLNRARARTSEAVADDIVRQQQRIEVRKAELAKQLPEMEHQTREMMLAGLAIAWIIVICSFAAVQITLHRVVRPLEDLVNAAGRIADGDLAARAPVAGDLEIAKLGAAFNHMADKLRSHARTDDLTGLPNFRAFREKIDEEIERAVRYPEQFGILVLDLDHFKQYNDRFGHLAGNDALQRVARALKVSVRIVDFAARYGGEEFAVIVPQIDPAGLLTIAERVRSSVESLPAPANGSELTISIGGALYPTDGTTVDALFHVADERLYQAKHEGRNRVVIPAPARRSADRQSA